MSILYLIAPTHLEVMRIGGYDLASDYSIFREFLKSWQVSVLQKSLLQTRTDLLELTRVLTWFDQLTQFLIPRITLIQCQTLLAEGFTNAVRHAHKNRVADTLIDIEVTLFDKKLEIRIWDSGQPFDLMQKLKTLPKTVDVNSPGGRGLKLFEKMADDFSYTREEGDRNCLLIVKYF